MRVLSYIFSIALIVNHAFGQEPSSETVIKNSEQVLSELDSAISLTAENSKEAFRLYNNAAQRFVIRGSYKDAETLFSKAESLAIYEPDSSKLMEMKLSKAAMHKEQGRFTISLQAYMESLSYYQNRQDVNGQLWVYGYLSEFYRATSNAELCLKFIEEGEALLATNEAELRPKAYLAFRRASYYLQFFDRGIQINFDRALSHLELAKDMAVESGDSYLVGLNENGLGFLLVHHAASESEKIVTYLESAKNHMLVNERFRNYGGVLHTLALHYTRTGHPEKAVDMTFEAIELSKENNWISTLSDYYRLAGEVFYELGRYQESATYLNDALMTAKEAMTETHSIELGELTASLEKNIAEQKLAEQETETRIARQRDKNSRKALIATISIALILTFITILSVRLYFRFKKNNSQLRSQQEVIKMTNKQLTEAVGQKNTLYRELNHRVKNNLTILTGLVYLQESVEKDPGHQKLYQTLRNRIQSMAIVHENLYALNEVQNINFHEYLKQLVLSIASTFQDDKKVITHIDCEGLNVGIDEAVPLAMVINELITNSFKHAFHQKNQGQIKVWSEIDDDKRIIHYTDDGSGMPSAFDHINAPSLGMRLVNLMVKQLKGELSYKGESGAYFKFEIPLNT